jgi:hypothetical protein
MLNVKEAWLVDRRSEPDLESPFFVAVRTQDGKTFQSIEDFDHLEKASELLFKVMDSKKASTRKFVESCQYGVDKLE